MSSPSVHHAPFSLDEKRPINGGATSTGFVDSFQNNHRKRRPIDPPEEGNATFASSQTDDYADATASKRRCTARPSPPVVDDLLGMLTLKPPDPPAHSFCKRKIEIGNQRILTKIPRCDDYDDELQGVMTTSKRMAGDDDQVTSQFVTLSTKPDSPSGHAAAAAATAAARTADQASSEMMDNEIMSIDDSISIDSNNSDSSISENSIRNAMYQAVFGRRRNVSQHYQFHSIPGNVVNSSSGLCYDVVDNKIEELIRRSRMKAEIQSRKEEKQLATATAEDGVNEKKDCADKDEMEMDE